LAVSANLEFLYLFAESLSVGLRPVDAGDGVARTETGDDWGRDLSFLPQLIDLELVTCGSPSKDNLPYAVIKQHIDDLLYATHVRMDSGGMGGWGGKPLRTLRISSLSDIDFEQLGGVAWAVHRDGFISSSVQTLWF
jgi:hypothetical protein